jgi:hypothetical protein
MVEEYLALRDNVVWLDKKQIIHSVFHGDQTRDKLRHSIQEMQDLSEELHHDDKPILMLADLRDVGEYPLESRMVGMRGRAQLPFWRFALVTTRDDPHNYVAVSKKLTAMSARKKEMMYFTSLPDAYHWLNELVLD